MPDRTPIAVEGHNCWQRAHADRLALLVDASDYYRTLEAALLRARRSVLILGWEFDSRVRLDRREDAPCPTIGALLRHIVRTRPELRVHVLVWDSALLYSFDREFLPVVKHDWLTHPRLRFRLDDSHPFGASHHQKVVVIDDRLAFLGGLDVSSRRWDCPEHRPDDPRRCDVGSPFYPPFHDVQVAVSGDAAARLGDLVRARWRKATGQRLAPPVRPTVHDPWPETLAPDIEDLTVALARTCPPWEGEPAVREVERLFVDMIAAARHHLYIENQYFASRVAARMIARRLLEAEGPEIAFVTSGFSTGFLERNTMGAARARLQTRLASYDRQDRLRLYAPTVDGRRLKVHSKVMVVDDRMLRVGSANLNNRSMGLDTECDLLVEACGEPRIATAIAGLRDRLLAEHLGRTPAEVGEAVRQNGLHAAIDRLGRPDRRLSRLAPVRTGSDFRPEPDLLDPEGPVEALLLAAAEMPPGPVRPPLAARFATGMAFLALLTLVAAVWHALPHPALDQAVAGLEVWRGHPSSPLLVGGAFLIAGLTGMPLFPLVLAAASLYGGWLGGIYSFAGALASAACSYSLGRALGRDLVRRLTGRRASRVSRALARHGVVAMAMLRIIPVASFTAVNLMAGASRIRHADYFTGSTIGLLPMVAGFSLFGDRFAAALRQPDDLNTGLLSLLTLLLAVAGAAVWSRMRRAAPTLGGAPAGE